MGAMVIHQLARDLFLLRRGRQGQYDAVTFTQRAFITVLLFQLTSHIHKRFGGIRNALHGRFLTGVQP